MCTALPYLGIGLLRPGSHWGLYSENWMTVASGALGLNQRSCKLAPKMLGSAVCREVLPVERSEQSEISAT